MARPSGRQHATSETFSYYPDGTIKTWTTRDGVVIRYTSDPGNRMIAAVPALAAGMALASSMAPLDGGERLARRSTFRLCEARVQAHTPELISGMGWSFALDAGQRLAGAFAGAGSLRESDSQESFERFRFAYGEGDGLSRMVREGAGEAVGFEVGVGGRIASRGGVAYLYDRSGRRVEDERFSYVWDWRGRLVQVDIKPGSGVRDASGRLLEGHRILYEHDALGRLLHRIHLGPLPQGERDEAKRPFVAKTRFFWEGNRLLAEEGLNFQGGLLWRKSYLSGPQRLDDVVQIKVETFAASDPTKPTSVRVYTVLKDELGSVVGLVEERAGSSPERPPMPARYLYTPYGEAHGEVGPEVREVRFESALTAVVTDGGTVTQVVVDEGKAAKGGLRITMALPVDPATLGEGVMVEKLVPGEGWKPVSQSEVMVAPTRAPPDHTAQDLPPGLDILALAGWPRGVSFRVRLTQALADLAGRPLAEEQSVVWSIPEGRDEVVFAQTFPVSYDTIQAASNTLGGAIPGGQTLLFHGLWTDPATGLAYARNRWYDPRTASWLSEDPLRDLDSPNLYAYVSWQPHMYTDPMGLARRTASGGVNALGDILNEVELSGNTPWWKYYALVGLDALGNTLSELLMLDTIAEKTTVFGDVSRSTSERIEAGAIGFGVAAFDVAGGEIMGTAGKVLTRIPGVKNLIANVGKTPVGRFLAQDVRQLFRRPSGKVATLEGTSALTREHVIRALEEEIQPFLPDIHRIAGPESRVGFRGSLARGTVGNPNKATYGKPINLDDFDVDAFIISDKLKRRGTWGLTSPSWKRCKNKSTACWRRGRSFVDSGPRVSLSRSSPGKKQGVCSVARKFTSLEVAHERNWDVDSQRQVLRWGQDFIAPKGGDSTRHGWGPVA